MNPTSERSASRPGFVRRTLLAARRKKLRTALVLAVLVVGGYFAFFRSSAGTAEAQYQLSAVQRGHVSATVTGTGQVAASSQVDVKAKASGDVLSVLVENRMPVIAGQALVRLDTREAEKAVRDARASLESAEISLEKTVKPADEIDIVQAENNLNQARSDLDKSYDDGFNSVSNAFIDLPDIVSGIQDLLYGKTVSKSSDQSNIAAYVDMVKNYDEKVIKFSDDATAKYIAARAAYDATFLKYRATNRTASRDEIASLIKETYTTTKSISEAVKSAGDLLSFVKDKLTERSLSVPAALTSHQTILSGYTSKTNSNLLTLLNITTSMTTATYSVQERTASLADLKNGADKLDIRSAQLSVEQRQNALRDAEEKLADYTPRSPFDGVVAKITLKKGDSISSGGTIATIITNDRLAELSLNEVDAAKVKVGQKATLTFDAIDGLTVMGTVSDVDTVGTVSQGVVTYAVKISFATDNAEIKPGMSVSAVIVTEEKDGVLYVPSSAIKTQGDTTYVEVIDDGVPVTTTSTTGATATGAALSNGTTGTTGGFSTSTRTGQNRRMRFASSTADGGLAFSTSTRIFGAANASTTFSTTTMAARFALRRTELVTSVAGPRRIPVIIGISGDTATEIISGLAEGDRIVSKTVTTGAKTTTTSNQNSLFSAPRGATSAVRVNAGGR